MNINTAKIESLVRQLLLEIGEDPERERLLKTPGRGVYGISDRGRGIACSFPTGAPLGC
jgi:GTP cyclohydrolase I